MSFGNLKDWSIVLDKLEELSKNGELHYHQRELIRILRFDQNWRLREAAIESLAVVENPEFDLFGEVFSLMMRNDLYYDVRILAADGLDKLMVNVVRNKTVDIDRLKDVVSEILEGMERLLACPEPPKFHDAIRHSSEKIKTIEARM
ncbi:hypothetical protein QUF76_06590 [Desulfobacterales bacterium HSG16]|nr:hypothetical protein [Desulfobacterales bacterium HSG16]